MDKQRIAELLRPFMVPSKAASNTAFHLLSENQLSNISTYIDILLRWNAHMNLTALRDPEQIVTRHFGESLFLASTLFPDPESAVSVDVADVGSGAGFPGLPLKIWSPTARLTLIEANQKKATFLREVRRALRFEDVQVLAERAETLAPRSFDLVAMRAVEKFASVLPIAAGLVRLGGNMTLLIGREQVRELSNLVGWFQWRSPIPLPLSNSRVLAIGTLEN